MSTAMAEEVYRFRGDDSAAGEVLARHAHRLALHTAAMILSSRKEAGDIAQDVGVDVLRSLDRLRDPEAFDGWVHRITVRYALRRMPRIG